ncbi:MAG: diaminopimelate decarboxylase [Candidatus Bathyarchaeia archaeon]
MLPPGIYENRNGVLHIEGVSALKLAEEFDTPLYVISETRIRENFRRLRDALHRHYGKVRVYYSAKANTNLSVLRILMSEGAYIDTISPGEVFLALKVGFPPEKILFTGTSVRDDELKFVVEHEVIINIDSLSQLRRLLKITTPEFLSVRVNPEIGAGHHEHVITAGRDSKFGIWESDVIRAYEMAKEAGVKRFGMHMHIGSGILQVEPFLLAAEKLLDIANSAHKSVGIDFDFIDFGGGLSVPYKPDEEEIDVDLYAEKVLGLFKDKVHEYGLGSPYFYVEPGRYIVCDACILLTKVNTVKVTPYKKFVGVDAGFNTLIRPVMYGSYHPIILANRLDASEEEVYDVAGPICESGDLLARNRKLPKVREGDLLAVLNAGAYGYSMSSRYNSRPKCAEVLLKDGSSCIVRERETLEDLLNGQKYPPWLSKP